MLFGSATVVRRFDPTRSDVDVLVNLGTSDVKALERLLETLGEEVASVREHDPSLVESLPGVHRIVGMSDRIVHVHDGIDYRLMWQVVALRVPEFAPKLGAAPASATIDAAS